MMESTPKLLNRVISVALWLVALAVLVVFCAGQLIPGSSTIWFTLSYFMVTGIAISLIFQCVSLVRPTNRDRDDWRNTVATAVLCLTALLAIWFAWNLIDAIAAGNAGQSENNLLMWNVINPLFVLVMSVTGASLWNKAAG